MGRGGWAVDPEVNAPRSNLSGRKFHNRPWQGNSPYELTAIFADVRWKIMRKQSSFFTLDGRACKHITSAIICNFLYTRYNSRLRRATLADISCLLSSGLDNKTSSHSYKVNVNKKNPGFNYNEFGLVCLHPDY